jgi:transketolase
MERNVQMVERPFGQNLMELGERHPNLIFLDADLQRGTESEFFQERFPERYFNVGVAEANMVGISTGLALSGKTVFCGTFACFITQRVCDQVAISVAYCKANVKLFGFEPGLYSGGNGATHQAVLDLAIMRTMPNMTVFDPGDAVELEAIMAYQAEHPGPAYMRAPRRKAPVLHDPGAFHYEHGRAIRMRDGQDVTIIACGIMLDRALQAAEELSEQGISARVLSMPSIKPIDEESILEAAQQTGCIVTAENHNILGGLGSAVAEVVSSKIPVHVIRVGIGDVFGEVGTQEWLAEHFSIGSKHIVQAALSAMELKGHSRSSSI